MASMVSPQALTCVILGCRNCLSSWVKMSDCEGEERLEHSTCGGEGVGESDSMVGWKEREKGRGEVALRRGC